MAEIRFEVFFDFGDGLRHQNVTGRVSTNVQESYLGVFNLHVDFDELTLVKANLRERMCREAEVAGDVALEPVRVVVRESRGPLVIEVGDDCGGLRVRHREWLMVASVRPCVDASWFSAE